jgi:hypothetical protein
VRLDEVVGAPLDGLERVAELAGCRDVAAVLDQAPRQHRHRERHGQAELDMIPGVVVAAHQVHLRRSSSRRKRKRAPMLADRDDHHRAIILARRSHVCTYPLLEAVGEAGVVAPGDALAVREPPRPLRLEVEQALLQRVLVVVRLPLGSAENTRESNSHQQQKRAPELPPLPAR